MSRFSKAEAETLGWNFTHDEPAQVEDLGDGIYRTKPADLRAEKITDGHVQTEQAETMGKLLERIFAWEKSQIDKLAPAPAPESNDVFADGSTRGDVNAGTGHGAEQFAPSASEDGTVAAERDAAVESEADDSE